MQPSAIPGKFLYFKWTLATSVGLASGLALYLFVPRPLYYTNPVIFTMLTFGFKWIHLIVGLCIGIFQGLVIRKYTSGILAWVAASTLGWSLAIGIGTSAFEVLFN